MRRLSSDAYLPSVSSLLDSMHRSRCSSLHQPAMPPVGRRSVWCIIPPCGVHLTSMSRIGRRGSCSCPPALQKDATDYYSSSSCQLEPERGIVFRATCCRLHYRSATARLMENAGNVLVLPSAMQMRATPKRKLHPTHRVSGVRCSQAIRPRLRHYTALLMLTNGRLSRKLTNSFFYRELHADAENNDTPE